MMMDNLMTYGLVALGLVLILVLRSVGNGIGAKLRRRKAHLTQARRHFVKAAMFLNKSRAEKVSASEARSLAGNAINEANLAIELDPKDAASLIVKSLALKQLGKPAAALKVLNTTLSKQYAKSLSNEERADTLVQRAQLVLEQMQGNRDPGMQDVLKDLQEAVMLSPSNARTHFMIGSCCERTGDVEDAIVAYQQAVVVNPKFTEAQGALDRLKASSKVSEATPTIAVSV